MLRRARSAPTPRRSGSFDRLHHLLLPAATLAIVGVGAIALHTREQAVAFLHSDAAVFARAQGEQGRGMVRHHLLRNAAVPALLLQFASLSELFGGAILAETVFSYPGLGQATAAAGIRGDVPLLLGIVLATTVFVYVGNLLGDVAHSVADPRVSFPLGAAHGGPAVTPLAPVLDQPVDSGTGLAGRPAHPDDRDRRGHPGRAPGDPRRRHAGGRPVPGKPTSTPATCRRA